METLQINQKTSRKKVFIVGILFLLILVTTILLFFLYPFASKEKVNFSNGKYAILLNKKIQGNGIMKNQHLYLPVHTLNTVLDDAIITENKSVIITTKQNVYYIPVNQRNYRVNQEKVAYPYSTTIELNNETYLSIDLLQSIYPIQYKITKDSRIVWIEKDKETYHLGMIKNKNTREAFLRLRTKPDLQAPYVIEVKKNQQIHIEKQIEDFYYVRTLEGVGGYIKADQVTKQRKKIVHITSKEKDIKLPSVQLPLHMSWEAVYSESHDTKKLPTMPGVNIVSPTWFELKDQKGNVTNLASQNYVDWAKKRNYQIWGVFSNGFDPELTKGALNSFTTREKIIQQLLNYAKTYHLDGINIDIENVSPEDGPLVTQFARELSAHLHRSGKLVSMDITFIATGNWSEFYERRKLSKVVDYIVVMAYDEHWASSETAGSVASLPWVEENLKSLLKEVPNKKLVLGLPLYTRLWKEVTANGKTTVSSSALSMKQAKAWVKEKKLKATEDPVSGQNYVEYKDPNSNVVYKMWLEDTLSLNKRVQIAQKYHLAGIASWSRYFADETAWTALESSLSAYNVK